MNVTGTIPIRIRIRMQVEPARGRWRKFPSAGNVYTVGVKDKFCLQEFSLAHCSFLLALN